MPGIYIHIPFCRQACSYCNFHFSTSLRFRLPLLEALIRELHQRKDYLSGTISTIYFGGGTPSLLAVTDIARILNEISKAYDVGSNAEITLEANPDDITNEKLQAWRNCGINRLSIGIQSFFQPHLQLMNRAHNADQARESLNLLPAHGFSNFTIDLIYGIPGLTQEQWQHNLDQLLHFQVPHFSAYQLTVEPKTLLQKQIENGAVPEIDEEQISREYEMLVSFAAQHDYLHYEISNFARPCFLSRHNSSYWRAEPYIGLGPSAHSFNGHSRSWNVSNNAQYIRAMNGGTPVFESEQLTEQQQFNELLMTTLRTLWGLYLPKVAQEFPPEYHKHLLNDIQPYLMSGKLALKDDWLSIPSPSRLFADRIISDLFWV